MSHIQLSEPHNVEKFYFLLWVSNLVSHTTGT